MSKKRSARPGAATPGQAGKAAAFGKASAPNPNSTTAKSGRQWRISDFIGRSRESATTCRELCALTGLDNRTCRKLIEQERRRGVPIISDNRHGYWISSSRSEIEHFYTGMRQRAFEIERTANFVLLSSLEATDE